MEILNLNIGLLPIITGIFVILLTYLFTSIIYALYFSPLSQYPGPRICALARLPWIIALLRGHQSHFARRLHTKYGPIVRIAPNELSFTSPQAWKDIYSHQQGRPEMMKNLKLYSQQPGSTHLLVANREDHARFRRTLSHAFSDASMREQERILQIYAGKLIEQLNMLASSSSGSISKNRAGHVDGGAGETSQKPTPLNITAWYNYTTFNLIGHLAFGEPFNCLETSTYHPWIRMIFANLKTGNYMQALSYFPFSIGKYIFSIFTPRKLIREKKEHHALTIAKVMKRLEVKEERNDFLGCILRKQGTEKGMSTQELIANSAVLILAGSETTATVLSGMTYFLLKDKRVMDKVVKEVRGTFQREEDITLSGVWKLSYMLACLDESMRIYPAAPVALQRIVPQEGALIDGHWVPGGVSFSLCLTVTLIFYFLTLLRNLERVSHPDPHTDNRLRTTTCSQPLANFHLPNSFIPERFLGDERFVNDKRNALNPFSLGPRNCIGKNLAYLEMRLILARVLWNFDIQFADGEADKDWLDQRSWTLWEKGPLNVILIRRDVN